MNSKSFYTKIAYIIANFAAKHIFHLEIIRNELKASDEACLIIANHGCMLDFVNIITALKRPLRFVISKSFFRTVPIPKLLKLLNPIPKQQFELDIAAIKEIFKSISNGDTLVLYPAGLMCEDGCSTPIPQGSYKLLKKIKTDIYMARSYGSYFVQPKWGKGFHPGKTKMDIFKLFSKEELERLSVQEIKERAEKALLFDSYEDQEKLMVAYKDCSNIKGLENVLYLCPHCKSEFQMEVAKNSIKCLCCGYEEKADQYGFLHRISKHGPSLKHASKWNSLIISECIDLLKENPAYSFSENVEIRMIDDAKRKYVPVGKGVLIFSDFKLSLSGTAKGEPCEIELSTKQIPMLPFVPGKQLELQYKEDSYRCVLENGRHTIKFINFIKASNRIAKENQKM